MALENLNIQHNRAIRNRYAPFFLGHPVAYVESLKQSSLFVIVFVFVFVCAIVTAKGVELMKMVG